MSEKIKVLRGSLILTVGALGSYGFSLLRNIILARVLAKADYGLAAMLGLTILLLEIASRMALGQQIIQSKDGGSEQFVATTHAFQFALALAGALLIFALSGLMAQVFKVPQLSWAFAALAVVPLARGFENLDYFRQQRELTFLPAVLCELIPQAATALAAWPLAVWIGDFRVIVVLMLSKAVLGILMTHLLAQRGYRWEWHGEYIAGMWRFGWPLLVNGVLIFASQQADQVVVGAFLSLEELAPYALAFSLVGIPWFVFVQVGSSLMLPILSRAQDDPEMFNRRYGLCVNMASVAAVLLTLPLVMFGEQIVRVLYGSKYGGSGLLMAILGASSAVRFLRFAPAIAATARGDTLNHLYSNVCRACSLPIALAVAVMGGKAAAVAICALFAEMAAAAVSLIRLRQRQGISYRQSGGAAAYVASFVGAGVALAYIGSNGLGYWSAAGCIVVLIAAAVGVAWYSFPNLSEFVVTHLARQWFAGSRAPKSAGLEI